MRHTQKQTCAGPVTRIASIEPLERRAYFTVDLTGSISVVGPASDSLKPGGRVTLAITVVNDGTTQAVGALQTAVGISPNIDGSAAQSLGASAVKPRPVVALPAFALTA